MVPRQADPQLERRILEAACRLWNRGGEKALTMRAVAKAAGTTTPTLYERYRDREDVLLALRMQIRGELFAAVRRSRTLREAVQRHIRFGLAHSHAYEVLFDGVGQPPSLYEPWPTFNFVRQRVTERVGGVPREHTRLMLGVWCLMHGTCMLIIRGRFEGALRKHTISACVDAVEILVDEAAREKREKRAYKWRTSLVLGEGPPQGARVRGNGSQSSTARIRSRAGKAR